MLQYPDPALFWNIREEQAFFDLRMEDICAFTGRNIPYHGRRMTTDASRRAFNHLLLEEEIMRYERERMIRVMGHHGPISSSDAANRQVMTALNPEYESEVIDAVNCGHDFENARVFSYVSDDETIMSEDEEEDNEHEDEPNEQVNMTFTSSAQRPLPLASTESGVVQVTMENLRNDDTLMVLDTGATAHVSKRLSGCINRRKLSNEIFGNHGEATPIVKRFDKAGILPTK